MGEFTGETARFQIGHPELLGRLAMRESGEALLAAVVEWQDRYLWRHQKDAVGDCEARFNDTSKHRTIEFSHPDRLLHPGANERAIAPALIRSPTASGKTEMALSLCERYLAVNPDAKVLFLSHKKDINDKAKRDFQARFGANYTYASLDGRRKPTDRLGTDFTFATFQSMSQGRLEYPEDAFDFIVVDEAHHSRAYSYEQVIRYFKPLRLLGMTATPDRLDLLDIREIYGVEAYELSLARALYDKILAKMDYRVILDDIMLDNLTAPDVSKLAFKKLNRELFIPRRDEEIAEIIKQHMSEISDVKHLAFASSIEHANRMAALLPDAMTIHSKMTQRERDEAMELFHAGKITTLITVDMFNEGIDIPDANMVSFLRSTSSETIFYQQLGRGLRKADGKENVRVLDFVANSERLALLANLIYGISQLDTAGRLDKFAKVPAPRSPEVIRQEIRELADHGIAGFNFDEQTIDIMAAAVRRRELEGYKDRYRELASTRRGVVLYLSSLRRTQKGKLPSVWDINAAHRRFGGPTANQLAKPFGGNLRDLIHSVDYALNRLSPAAKSLNTMRTWRQNPVYDSLMEIIQRHRDTKLADVRKFGEPEDEEMNENYDDRVDFRVEGRPYEYSISYQILDGVLHFWRRPLGELNAEHFEIVEYEGKSTINSDLFMEGAGGVGEFFAGSVELKGEKIVELLVELNEITEKLAAARKLRDRWYHDEDLLPENINLQHAA
ncbi:MAG TPA: DEAD/DEAH box helicase [Candidatus Saccharimonadales bacterium]|nr:DEAD/DEAH box helicase [Candidatus Saccharimonadales bacterium]